MASASKARKTVAPTAPKARRASVTNPSALSTNRPAMLMRAMAMALRRPNLTNALRARGAGSEKLTSAIISPGNRVLTPTPASKSSTAKLRLPSLLTTSALAPRVMSGGILSAAGEALAKLPPMVPWLRICTEPTCRAACANTGACRTTSGLRAT